MYFRAMRCAHTNSHVLRARYTRRQSPSSERNGGPARRFLPRGFLTSRGGGERRGEDPCHGSGKGCIFTGPRSRCTAAAGRRDGHGPGAPRRKDYTPRQAPGPHLLSPSFSIPARSRGHTSPASQPATRPENTSSRIDDLYRYAFRIALDVNIAYGVSRNAIQAWRADSRSFAIVGYINEFFILR